MSPPETRTRPSSSCTALCSERDSTIGPVRVQVPPSTTLKTHGVEPQLAVLPEGVEIVNVRGPKVALGAITIVITALVFDPVASDAERPVPLNVTEAPMRSDPVILKVFVPPGAPAVSETAVTEGGFGEYTRNGAVAESTETVITEGVVNRAGGMVVSIVFALMKLKGTVSPAMRTMLFVEKPLPVMVRSVAGLPATILVGLSVAIVTVD